MQKRHPEIDDMISLIRERVTNYELAEEARNRQPEPDPNLVQIRMPKKRAEAPARV